jgi:hypothetical protein
MSGKYDKPLDRESAYEILTARAAAAADEAEKAEEAEEKIEDVKLRDFTKARRFDAPQVGRSTSRRSSKTESIGGAIANVVIKELKGTTGKRIVRGILGGLFKGR